MAQRISSMGFLGSGQMARALVKGFVKSSEFKLISFVVNMCSGLCCLLAS